MFAFRIILISANQFKSQPSERYCTSSERAGGWL